MLILSLPAGWYFWHEEAIGIRVSGTIVFAVLAGAILFIIERLHRTLREVEARDQQLLVINRELQHRIKNLFAITSAISVQTIRARLPVDETIAAVSGRIGAIASAQELLGVAASQGADLAELVSSLVSPLAPAGDRLYVTGPLVRLQRDHSTPFALILHELATNALKHGAWSGSSGIVEIAWTTAASDGRSTLELHWTERDGPAASGSKSGLGLKLIRTALPGAEVTCSIEPTGMRVAIKLASVGPNLREH